MWVDKLMSNMPAGGAGRHATECRMNSGYTQCMTFVSSLNIIRLIELCSSFESTVRRRHRQGSHLDTLIALDRGMELRSHGCVLDAKGLSYVTDIRVVSCVLHSMEP